MPIGRSILTGKPKLDAGQRDKLVTVQTKVDAISDSGFPTDGTWTNLAKLYMSREDVRADERMAAGMDSAFTETLWHGPYVSTLDPEVIDVPSTKRLVYKGRVYNIRAASLMERRTGIEYLTLAQVG